MQVKRSCVVVLLIVAVVAILAGPSAGYAQDGWKEHQDPSGVTLQYPPDWTVTSQDGLVLVLDPTQNAFVVVYTFPTVAGYTIENCVEEVTTLLLTGATVVEQAVSEGDVPTITATLNVNDGVTDITAYMNCQIVSQVATLYMAAAVTDQFEDFFETQFAILQSVTTDVGVQSGIALDTGVEYATWTDPNEGAFTVEVPSEWTIEGGILDINGNKRTAMQMTSPEEDVFISFGMNEIYWFLQPNESLEAEGHTVGSTFFSENGLNILVGAYMTGGQFARFYAESLVGSFCGDMEITFNRELEDQSGFSDDGYSYLSAGEVAFTCNLLGESVVGYYYVLTRAMNDPDLGEVWTPDNIVGYVAAADKANLAGTILTRAYTTFAVSPEWTAQQEEIARQAAAAATNTYNPYYGTSAGYDDYSWQVMSDVSSMMHETNMSIIYNMGSDDWTWEYVDDSYYGW